MKRALDAADLELVKLMVMGEGLDLDDALAVHYAVQHCGRDVVKALLELGVGTAAGTGAPSSASGRPATTWNLTSERDGGRLWWRR